MAIWNILQPFGNLVELWFIFSRFGTLNREKSGNPASEAKLEAIMLEESVYVLKNSV
jgi:hypothetical protein